MATKTKIDFWRPDGGWGRAFVVEGARKGSVFIHHSVVTPRPTRGADLTGQEVWVDGVEWGEAKGPRALGAYTVQAWQWREAQAERERAKAEEAARAEAEKLARPHVEIRLHYKERAKIAGVPELLYATDDLVVGVGGTVEEEYGHGKLDSTTKRFFPVPMGPDDKFVIRHWGFEGKKHDEYLVYRLVDGKLVLVETIEAAALRRERWIAGRPFIEVGCGYKSSCRVAEEGSDPLWGVAAEMDSRPGGAGRLDGSVVTFVPAPMQPRDKFVIRHWGIEGQRHDELMVYDHELKLVETLDAQALEREAARGGKPHFEVELGYTVRLEEVNPELAQLGIQGTLVSVDKIDWVTSAKTPVQRSKIEVTVSRPLVAGEFVALRQWKGGGDGWDEVVYFDHNLQEVSREWVEDLERKRAKAALRASVGLESQLRDLRQKLAAKEAELKRLRREAHGKPGFWARRNVDPVEEEVFNLRDEIRRLGQL